ncbi:toxin-antitoxin system antitoxin subunit [Nocardioides humilatus]|uniref:Toxin-antitoxin system antitoxin subunit n=1 Tax=Nocardioides humilatus TaxID=2607660 RepID=A0A5B1LHX8_9ACTN|nr:toxin-antitoxin system antitoxin subunit [Nocardioides humilatus]KAA1420262.1 toxin-antitoxin system antitoxin subunit [Nocardioides humilatus]
MTTRITVSLADHLVAHAKRAVEEGEAASVSDFVARAMQEKAAREPLGDFFEEFDKEFGPPSVEDKAWARAELARADAEMAAKEAARDAAKAARRQ